MYSRCEFVQVKTGRVACRRCGNRMKSDSPETCFAECRAACAHLGEAVASIKVECDTCQGLRMVERDANVCVAFGANGRCLPKYRPADLTKWRARKPESDIYHLCHGCERFESIPPTPGAE